MINQYEISTLAASPLSFRKRSREPLGSYFAWGTFINLRRAAWWRATLQVDDKKVADLSVETWSVYTSCSKSPRNDIWEFECPPLHRHTTVPVHANRTFWWKLHQRTVKFCIPMWEAFEYPSWRRCRLGKSISTEIGSSPADSREYSTVFDKNYLLVAKDTFPFLFSFFL